MPTHRTYLKMIGAHDLAVTRFPWKVDPGLAELIRFPKDQFPDGILSKGDQLFLYAVGGWKSVFGLVDVVGDPVRDVPGARPDIQKRWPHGVAVKRTPLYVEDLENAPALWDISPDLSREIGQGVSHILMNQTQIDAARGALRRAGIKEGRA
jgi:hypothetical protein